MNINKFAHNQQKQIQKIFTKLTEGSLSQKDYLSTQQGFFASDEGKYPFEVGHELLPELPSNLNRSIQLLYKIIGDPKREAYLGAWTIMSVEHVLSVYNDYLQSGQDKVFDVAYEYIGMGHIRVLACDLTTHSLFYHNAGGSSGWDREENFQELIKKDPSDEPQHYFTDWFMRIDTTII